MITVYKKIWFILTKHEKKRAILLLFLMIIMAIFEVLGVGSIMPFLSVLGNQESIHTNKYLFYFLCQSGFLSSQQSKTLANWKQKRK